jgi:hypothetical protein
LIPDIESHLYATGGIFLDRWTWFALLFRKWVTDVTRVKTLHATRKIDRKPAYKWWEFTPGHSQTT